MLIYYANNGLSFRRADPSLALLPAEIAFDHAPSEDELVAAFPAHLAAKVAASAPTLLRAALAAGLTITSSATPALNGSTYAVDIDAQHKIAGVAAGIASRSRLPGGGATFAYADLAGGSHVFAAADFLNFAAAVEDYVYALESCAAALAAGQAAQWPPATATIA